MFALYCPVCGEPVSPADFNLIGLYQKYLILTFLLSLAIRFHQYRANLGFLLKVPKQWPNMYAALKEHSGVLLTWTLIVPVGITLAVLVSHSLCYYLVWSEANVSARDLFDRWGTLIPIVGVGVAMLTLDLLVLFRMGNSNFDAVEAQLSRGELALTSRTLKALRAVSFGRFDPQRIVGDRLKGQFAALRIVLIEQLRRWSFHSAVRIAFGFLLWLAWARVAYRMATGGYWAWMLGVLSVLAVFLFWMRRRRTPEPDAASAPSEP